MTTIAIIDYGMGNLMSVQKGFESLGFNAVVTNDLHKIEDATHVVLPGVGAFKDAITALASTSLDEAVHQTVKKGKPLLGICLGMQLLMTQSFEFGTFNGLNIIEGAVSRFPKDLKFNGKELKVPHMGWNNIDIVREEHSKLFHNIPQSAYFYFVHSYCCVPTDIKAVAARTNYGIIFTSAFEIDNVFATQFHPEKSQKYGLKVLDNFARIKS